MALWGDMSQYFVGLSSCLATSRDSMKLTHAKKFLLLHLIVFFKFPLSGSEGIYRSTSLVALLDRDCVICGVLFPVTCLPRPAVGHKNVST